MEAAPPPRSPRIPLCLYTHNHAPKDRHYAARETPHWSRTRGRLEVERRRREALDGAALDDEADLRHLEDRAPGDDAATQALGHGVLEARPVEEVRIAEERVSAVAADQLGRVDHVGEGVQHLEWGVPRWRGLYT